VDVTTLPNETKATKDNHEALMNNSTSRRAIARLAVYVLALAAMAGVSSARAGTLAVSSLNDSGPGSLRQAIADATPGDTITFSVKGTITLTSGALTIGKDLDVQGPGPNKLKISGNNASRVFVILEGATVIIQRVTVCNGLVDGDSLPDPSVGGGILNYGSLILSDVVVSGNQAFGRWDVSPNGFSGAAVGGGIANMGDLVVVGSSFMENLVRASDSNIEAAPVFLAGIAYAGAIYNDINAVCLTVTGSTFRRNQAIGGSGWFSVILSGHGSGGAIGSQAEMVVSECQFDHNIAIAGENNKTLLPGGLGPNKATAGAINISGGTATIDGCTFEHNQAVGGGGGIGCGGGIVVTDVVAYGVEATVSNCKVAHNRALGGPAVASGKGGDGTGGGIACINGATLTVINSTVAHNHARGGEAELGGSGGNGYGGGIYAEGAGMVTGPTKLNLVGAVVTFNLALGGEAAGEESDGQGIGGGVYRLGIYSADTATVIQKNRATTSHDNIYP
jgi:hypothetical protein